MGKKDRKQADPSELAEFVQKKMTLPGQALPEIADVVTGELFQPYAMNHYEWNDGVPHAPPIDMPRLSLRERVARLQGQGVDLYSRGVDDDTEEGDFEDPDESEPLTHAETMYLAGTEAREVFSAEQRLAAEKAKNQTPPQTPTEGSTEPPKSGGVGGEAPTQGAPKAP